MSLRDQYKPSPNVQAGHAIGGSSFDVLINDPMAYGQRAGGIVVLLLGLAILSSKFLAWGFIFRCCCKSCKCLPKNLDSKTFEERQLLLKNRQFYWTISFFCICMSVIIVDCVIFLGGASFQKGVKDVSNGMIAIKDFIETFKDSLDIMSTSSLSWQMAAASASSICYKNAVAVNSGSVVSDSELGVWVTLRQDNPTDCQAASGKLCGTLLDIIQPIMESVIPPLFDTQGVLMGSFSSTASSLTGFLDDIVGFIDTGNTYWKSYAGSYIDIAIYALWAIAMSAMVFFIIFRLLKFTCGLQTTMFFSFVTIFIIAILNFIWLTLTLVTADFCMNPAENIINAVGKNSSTADTLRFYFYNEGESRIQKDIESMKTKFQSAISDLQKINNKEIPNDLWTQSLSFPQVFSTDPPNPNRSDQYIDIFKVTQCSYAANVPHIAAVASSCGTTADRSYAFVRTQPPSSDIPEDPDYGYWDYCPVNTVNPYGNPPSNFPCAVTTKTSTPPVTRGNLDSVPIVALCGNPNTITGFDFVDYTWLDYSHGSLYMKMISDSAEEILGAIDKVKDGVGYEKLNKILRIFIQEAICTNFYDGTYYVWISQTVTALLLWFAVLICSFTYHYFPGSNMMKVYLAAPEEGQGQGEAYYIETGGEEPGTYREDGSFVEYPKDNPVPAMVMDNGFDPEYNYVDQDNTNTDNYFDDSNIRTQIEKSET